MTHEPGGPRAAAVDESSRQYQPGAFWEARLTAQFDLAGVGFRRVSSPKRGWRLGQVLGAIDRVLTRLMPRGGPSTEILVARRR